MNFGEALKILNIEDYAERIYNSNSHGELFYLMDYITFAEFKYSGWFRLWFMMVVENAEKNWSRPESVFQHIPRIFRETAKGVKP